jgi:hypothetical protein
MRMGVAALEAPIEQADDWIWMADHSNQIGQEKALAIIGLRASKMPSPGTAIRHEDVRLLMLEPGINWKTADMSAAYERLAVTFVNEQGLFCGAADQLSRRFRSLELCGASQTVADGLLEFLRDHELKLQDGQRLPMSPEILESCFGLFKQLERQHSKGGFTSLLASFGALLQPATPESLRDAFGRVSVKQMRTWVSDNLGTTIPSKRKTAYAESKTIA